jgi:hypothetical protein
LCGTRSDVASQLAVLPLASLKGEPSAILMEVHESLATKPGDKVRARVCVCSVQRMGCVPYYPAPLCNAFSPTDRPQPQAPSLTFPLLELIKSEGFWGKVEEEGLGDAGACVWGWTT